MAEIVLEEHILECGICFERMDETCRMLPCQHTYCKACLENLHEHEGCLRCPQCRTLVSAAVRDLPKNLVMLNLIEKVKQNPPPKPKTEDEELAKAITVSLEEFMSEKATDLLLKHNEQLQTQLALENSKREALLQSAKEMSAEYNELFQYEAAIKKSKEDESIREKSRNFISEMEKLECELALLKSQLEINAARSARSTAGIASLFSWFATHSSDFSDAQRRDAQIVLQRLRLAVATQSDDVTQKHLLTVIDKMKACGSKKSSDQNEAANATVDGDCAIDDVMKKLEEVNTMLRQEESRNGERNDRFHRNCLNYPNYLNNPPNFIPPLMSNLRMFTPKFNDHRLPYPPYTGGRPPNSFPPSVQPSFYWPPSAYPPRLSSFKENSSASNFLNRGENVVRGRGSRGRGECPKPVFEKMGLNKLTSSRNASGNALGSLILPDVRDYERLEKKRDGNINHKKNNATFGQSSSVSSEKKPGPLLLPDVRLYDMVYSKFPEHLDTIGDKKHDIESFGCNYQRRRKSFDSASENTYSARSQRNTNRERKLHRGRGEHCSSDNSKPNKKNDGFESDSSGTSVVSCTSRFSSSNTSVPSPAKENRCRGNNRRKQKSYNYPRSRKNFQEKGDICDDNNKQENHMKRLTYPSKKEALERNIDLMKRFETPVICLGKDATKPVSRTAECLAEIYEFEETYQECRIIRI